MPAFLQKLEGGVSLLRQGPECRHYGDPYEWACVVVERSPVQAEILGVDKPLSLSIWKDVMTTLAQEGVNHLLFERVYDRHNSSLKNLPVRSY